MDMKLKIMALKASEGVPLLMLLVVTIQAHQVVSSKGGQEQGERR